MITLGIADLEKHLRASAVFLAKGKLPELCAGTLLPPSLDKGQELLLVILEVPK